MQFFLPIMLFGNAQFFLPIMLKIMPNYASKFYYITILIEQEMTILSFTRNKK